MSSPLRGDRQDQKYIIGLLSEHAPVGLLHTEERLKGYPRVLTLWELLLEEEEEYVSIDDIVGDGGFCGPWSDSGSEGLSEDRVKAFAALSWGRRQGEATGTKIRTTTKTNEIQKQITTQLILPRGAMQDEKQMFVCKFYIGLEDDQEFCIVKRIIGKAGNNMKRIAEDCCAKLRLRGRGSGFFEKGKFEKNSPLELHLSCTDFDNYAGGVRRIAALLDYLYKHHRRYRRSKGLEAVDATWSIRELRRDDQGVNVFQCFEAATQPIGDVTTSFEACSKFSCQRKSVGGTSASERAAAVLAKATDRRTADITHLCKTMLDERADITASAGSNERRNAAKRALAVAARAKSRRDNVQGAVEAQQCYSESQRRIHKDVSPNAEIKQEPLNYWLFEDEADQKSWLTDDGSTEVGRQELSLIQGAEDEFQDIDDCIDLIPKQPECARNFSPTVRPDLASSVLQQMGLKQGLQLLPLYRRSQSGAWDRTCSPLSRSVSPHVRPPALKAHCIKPATEDGMLAALNNHLPKKWIGTKGEIYIVEAIDERNWKVVIEGGMLPASLARLKFMSYDSDMMRIWWGSQAYKYFLDAREILRQPLVLKWYMETSKGSRRSPAFTWWPHAKPSADGDWKYLPR